MVFDKWKSQVKSKNIIVRILILSIFLLFVPLYSIQTVYVTVTVVFWQLFHSNLSIIMAHLIIVFTLANFVIYSIIASHFLLILILIPVDFLLITLFLLSLYLQLLSFGRQDIVLVCLLYIQIAKL